MLRIEAKAATACEQLRIPSLYCRIRLFTTNWTLIKDYHPANFTKQTLSTLRVTYYIPTGYEMILLIVSNLRVTFYIFFVGVARDYAEICVRRKIRGQYPCGEKNCVRKNNFCAKTSCK